MPLPTAQQAVRQGAEPFLVPGELFGGVSGVPGRVLRPPYRPLRRWQAKLEDVRSPAHIHSAPLHGECTLLPL